MGAGSKTKKPLKKLNPKLFSAETIHKKPLKILRENRREGGGKNILEVRRYDNGVWVENGTKRVWILEKVSNEINHIHREMDNPFDGEVVYTHHSPLKLGAQYHLREIQSQATNETIVVSRLGFAYQLIGEGGGLELPWGMLLENCP